MTAQMLKQKNANGSVAVNQSADSSGYFSFLGSHWWTPVLFFSTRSWTCLYSLRAANVSNFDQHCIGQWAIVTQESFRLINDLRAGDGAHLHHFRPHSGICWNTVPSSMQHPYVLVGLSVLFIALALSMFGLYSLQLPSRAQTWLNSLSNQQRSGNSLGVFAMGAISGLVCSPCTTAPLSGALLYVAQTGNLFIGGITLYALALGMGIPLILAAVFGNKLLPKSGDWMNKVKALFGFILLAAPIFLLERMIPEFWASILWSILGIAAFGWLYHVKNSFHSGGWKQSVVAIIAILGMLFSAQPILHDWYSSSNTTMDSRPTIEFVRIHNINELNAQLEKAKLEHKPVMLDFYADWCVACKEFEKYTFHEKAVEEKLQHFVLLQVDVTKSLPEDFKLMQKMNVLGLPTIEFWNAKGEHMVNARVTGFKDAKAFLVHMNQFDFTTSNK